MESEIKTIIPAIPLALDNLPIHFIDVETVSTIDPKRVEAEGLPELFLKKFRSKMMDMELGKGNSLLPIDFYAAEAGLFAEFGKIICISMGMLYKGKFYIRNIFDVDEKKILVKFNETLLKSEATTLCAHNGLDFDYPYIYRRCIANSVPPPALLEVAGKKPWELTHLMDTMKLWSHTAWNYRASLDLLASLFGFPSPKEEIDGSTVNSIYWSIDHNGPQEFINKELSRIADYCAGDVFTLANVYLRIKGLKPMDSSQIIIV